MILWSAVNGRTDEYSRPHAGTVLKPKPQNAGLQLTEPNNADTEDLSA